MSPKSPRGNHIGVSKKRSDPFFHQMAIRRFLKQAVPLKKYFG